MSSSHSFFVQSTLTTLYQRDINEKLTQQTTSAEFESEEEKQQSELTASLISHDEYANNDRKQKLSKIRKLQGELSQHVNAINTLLFLSSAKKAIIQIKNIVINAIADESVENNLLEKINKTAAEWGITIQFKNNLSAIALLNEVCDEYQRIEEQYSTHWDSSLLLLEQKEKVEKELYTLILEYQRELTEENDLASVFRL
jgi:hypothetical protein